MIDTDENLNISRGLMNTYLKGRLLIFFFFCMFIFSDPVWCRYTVSPLSYFTHTWGAGGGGGRGCQVCSKPTPDSVRNNLLPKVTCMLFPTTALQTSWSWGFCLLLFLFWPLFKAVLICVQPPPLVWVCISFEGPCWAPFHGLLWSSVSSVVTSLFHLSPSSRGTWCSSVGCNAPLFTLEFSHQGICALFPAALWLFSQHTFQRTEILIFGDAQFNIFF